MMMAGGLFCVVLMTCVEAADDGAWAGSYAIASIMDEWPRLQYDDGREAAAVPMAEDATEVSMAWTGG